MLHLTDAAGATRSIELAEPQWRPVGVAGTVTIAVHQIGTNGLSPAVTLSYSPEMTR